MSLPPLPPGRINWRRVGFAISVFATCCALWGLAWQLLIKPLLMLLGFALPVAVLIAIPTH